MKNKLFLLLCIPFLLTAQVLRVSVDLSFDHLPPIEQQFLENFKTQIEDYYNNFSWTDDEFETDVETKINIISTQAILPKKYVSVIEFNNSVYLLGVSEQSVNLIDKYEESFLSEIKGKNELNEKPNFLKLLKNNMGIK